MSERREMSFHDKRELVLKQKATTLRYGDKYNQYHAGDQIVMRIAGEESMEDTLVDGVVLAHWSIPFSQIPAALISGEAYDIQAPDRPITRTAVEFLLAQSATVDLQQYYENAVNEDEEFHVMVCIPEDRIEDWRNHVQIEGENPEAWLARCGDFVFGHIDAYQALQNSIEP